MNRKLHSLLESVNLRGERRIDLPLLLCGVLQAYLAVHDPLIFNLITQGDLSSRLVVSLATVITAAVPFSFALGSIKEAVIPEFETVFYYEHLLGSSNFWLFSGIFMIGMAIASWFGSTIQSVVGIADAAAGAYLMYLAYKKSRRPT